MDRTTGRNNYGQIQHVWSPTYEAVWCKTLHFCMYSSMIQIEPTCKQVVQVINMLQIWQPEEKTTGNKDFFSLATVSEGI